MSNHQEVVVSDPWLQSQFTQVELRSLKSRFISARDPAGRVALGELPPLMVKLKVFSEMFTEEEIKAILGESSPDMNEEIDFESFLRAYLNLQARAMAKLGDSKTSIIFRQGCHNCKD